MAPRSLPRLAALLALCAAPVATPASASGGFVVVVHQSNPATSLSRSELKRAVTGGIRQWDNGAVVQVGVIPSDAPETQHLAELLDMTPRELLARLQEQVFKGEIRRPQALRSSSECVAFASVNAGAICVAVDSEPVPPGPHVVAIR